MGPHLEREYVAGIVVDVTSWNLGFAIVGPDVLECDTLSGDGVFGEGASLSTHTPL